MTNDIHLKTEVDDTTRYDLEILYVQIFKLFIKLILSRIENGVIINILLENFLWINSNGEFTIIALLGCDCPIISYCYDTNTYFIPHYNKILPISKKEALFMLVSSFIDRSKKITKTELLSMISLL